mmetsp:Transcript_4482/g.6013  ORF Transcript_4482/g.6013 Transcript_4482/m.6013 type:complete len:232 (-) Transcript_4482:532-1227(-)
MFTSSSTSSSFIDGGEETGVELNPNCWHQKIVERHCQLRTDPNSSEQGNRKQVCETIERLLEKCPGKETEEMSRKVLESETDVGGDTQFGEFHGFQRPRFPGQSDGKEFESLEREMMERFGAMGMGAVGGMMERMMEQFAGGMFGGFNENERGHGSFDPFPGSGGDNNGHIFSFSFPGNSGRHSDSEQPKNENQGGWRSRFHAPHRENAQTSGKQDADTTRRERVYETDEI